MELSEILLDAYRTLFETADENEAVEQNYISLLTFEGNDEGQLEEIVDLFNGKHRGVLLLDFEDRHVASIPPTMVNVLTGAQVEYSKGEYDGAYAYSVKVTTPNDELVGEVTKEIARLVYELGSIGNGGHSFDIRFVPESRQAKYKMFGWDGDGSDRIKTDNIRIDDTKIKPDKLFES